MKMKEPTEDTDDYLEHARVIQLVYVQVVVQRTVRMILGEEPELGAGATGRDVGADVRQDVRVA